MRRVPLLLLATAAVLAAAAPAAAASGAARAARPGGADLPAAGSPDSGAGAAVNTAPAPAAVDPRGDFDGDGFADLAIGVPREDIGIDNAGSVNVLYGSPTGLRPARNQFWTQDSPGIPGAAQAAENFGSALAVGDFDGDGFADLAVGASKDRVQDGVTAGSVTILYGAERGLSSAASQSFSPGAGVMPGQAGAQDRFGAALAAGDFDGDGHDDLAVGAYQDQVLDASAAGSVTILYGTPDGLRAGRAVLVNQNTDGIGGEPNNLDWFGFALAAGELGRGEQDDLAIGAPFDEVAGTRGGTITVLYGGPNGLAPGTSRRWSRASEGVQGRAVSGDGFGYALAAGDMGRTPRDDLAVGAVGQDVGGVADAGGVSVLYGGPDGVSANGDQLWTQASPGILGEPQVGDSFGLSLAVANLGGGERPDLAIGVPGEPAGSLQDAGAVNVLYGGETGLRAFGSQRWSLGRDGVLGDPRAGDVFGATLTAADYGRSSLADLAVGVPGRLVAGADDAGAVSVLHGTTEGLSAANDQLWTQGSPQVAGQPAPDDFFGYSLG